MKSNESMRRVPGAMPERNPIVSIVLGAVAMFLEFFGYLFLSQWMRAWSPLGATVMLIAAALVYTAGTAHHVLCGAAEWMHIRQGCTEEARRMTTDFFHKTALTLVLCYTGILAFSVAMLLPVWAAVFNLIPLYLVQAPFRVPGAGIFPAR